MHPTTQLTRTIFILLISSFLVTCQEKKEQKAEEWIDLFNGQDLTGWKSNENDSSFHVEEGMIIATGPRSHLFFTGTETLDSNFNNFELTTDIMTTYLANSGVYFHTSWQDEGWPERGYEAQVNVSHKGAGDYKEVKKGGSLYGIRNTYKVFAEDSTWYTMKIRVVGKKINIWINDMMIVDYIEPNHPVRFGGQKQALLTGGTFALQCHDPDSKVFFKNMKIKVLPDELSSAEVMPNEKYQEILELQSEHFPVMDLHVVASGNFNVDSVVNVFYESGINFGLVADLTETDAAVSAEVLESHIQSLKGYPVFIGTKISLIADRPYLELPPEIEYVIGDFPVIVDEDTEDRYGFMSTYLNNLISAIHGSEIDILSNPTLLPTKWLSEYEALWTEEKMLQLIEVLQENEIAIEINNELRIPSIEFIKLAKENGCKFSCKSMTNDDGTARFDYLLEVIESADLDYKDIFIPGNK